MEQYIFGSIAFFLNQHHIHEQNFNTFSTNLDPKIFQENLNSIQFNSIQFQIQGGCNWSGVCYKWILQQSPRPMHFLINQAHPIIISSKASNKF
jgi:hypothetical protein